MISTLVVGIIVAGIVATGPAAPVVTTELLVSTEFWMPLIFTGGMLYGWSEGFKLIREGIQGK